jgi:hypothetical protein
MSACAGGVGGMRVHVKGLLDVGYAEVCFSSMSGVHAVYISVVSLHEERRVGLDVVLKARAVVSVVVRAMIWTFFSR